MIKKKLLKFWNNPNQWVSGMAFLLLSSFSITTYFKGLMWLLNTFLTTQLFSLLGILVLVISGLVIIRKILSYRTIKFYNQSILAKYSLTLYLLNWYRGKQFRKVHLEKELLFFNDDKRLYNVEFPTYLQESSLTESRPTIIYRIPARPYMPIPDFINLHLLHRLLIAGANVIVIVTDVLYSEERISNSAINFTVNICKKVLGTYARVEQLSKICVENSIDFTQFVLNNYASYFAMNDNKLIDFKQSRENDKSIILRANSFMAFGLFLFSISKLVLSHNTVLVMQWRERISKWKEYSSLIKSITDVYIKGLIVNETLMDYNNNPILTGSYNYNNEPLFTMTDDPDFVARKIFDTKLIDGVIQWKIDQSYFNLLHKLIFGFLESKINSRKSNYFKRKVTFTVAKKFIEDKASREYVLLNKWDELYIRTLFYKNFSSSRRLIGSLYL